MTGILGNLGEEGRYLAKFPSRNANGDVSSHVAYYGACRYTIYLLTVLSLICSTFTL